jgi:hypothetical protein
MLENQKFFYGMTIKRAATRAINIMDYYDWGILEIYTWTNSNIYLRTVLNIFNPSAADPMYI